MKQASTKMPFSASATRYAVNLDQMVARMGAAMMLDDLMITGDVSAATCQQVAAALYPDPAIRQIAPRIITHKMM